MSFLVEKGPASSSEKGRISKSPDADTRSARMEKYLKEKAEDLRKTGERASKNLEAGIKDPTFEEKNLDTPEGVQKELIKINIQSKALFDSGIALSGKISDFEKGLQRFEETKKEWSVFARGITWGDDSETKRLKDEFARLKREAEQKLRELQEQQVLIARYSRQVIQAAEMLRVKVSAERDLKFAELRVSGDTIESKHRKNESQYQKLSDEREKLISQGDSLRKYHGDLQLKLHDASSARQAYQIEALDIERFSTSLDLTLTELDSAISLLPLDSPQRILLEEKKQKLLEQQVFVKAALGEADSGLAQKVETERALGEESTSSAMRLRTVDDYLGNIVEPSLETMNISIHALEIAQQKNGTSREQLEAHYTETLDALSDLNTKAVDSISETTHGNFQMIKNLEKHVASFDQITIEGPGLWDATGGLVLGKIGEGWKLLTKDVICDMMLDPTSRFLKRVTKDIPVVNVLTEMTTAVIFDLPSGIIEGTGELIQGISTMLGSPVDTAKGLSALAGRDPRNGNWSFANALSAWHEMGKALIAYENFERGEIGKGTGKILLNVVLTATGIGALSKGSQAASLAYSIAKSTGRGSARATLKTVGTGSRIFGTEFAGGVAKMPGQILSGVGKVARAPSAFGKSMKEFFALDTIGKAEKSLKAVSGELQKVSDDIEEVTIGNRNVRDIEGLASRSADELAKLKPAELMRYGITDAQSIRAFLRLRELAKRKEQLFASRNRASLKRVDAKNIEYLEELVEEFTKGLIPKEKQLFAEICLDPKTGMLNRSGLSFLKRMIAGKKQVSIASFDGDHFKALNTAAGRQFGDFAINLMGEQFHSLVRSLKNQGYEVYAVRMGGEEFVLFGDVPKEVLAWTMEEASATLKENIRNHLTPRQMDAIAFDIFTSKYIGDKTHGLKRAYREIGGSTSSITEVHLPDLADAGFAAKKALQMADGFLERAKNEGGRGKVYLDQRDIQTVSSRVKDFIPENSLHHTQNAFMDDLANRLKGEVTAQLDSRTPSAHRILGRFALDPEKIQLIEDFFETPPFTLEKIEEISRATGISIEDLRQAKLERVTAAREYGTYTGAATMRKIESLGSEFGEIRTIEIGEFKSINETMGHTHGDTFLTWIYQEVILPAIRETGIPEEQIVVAQKGANFHYRLHDSVAYLQDLFNNTLRVYYESKSHELFATIDAVDASSLITRGPSYITLRTDWIASHRASTASESIARMYSLAIH